MVEEVKCKKRKDHQYNQKNKNKLDYDLQQYIESWYRKYQGKDQRIFRFCKIDN